MSDLYFDHSMDNMCLDNMCKTPGSVISTDLPEHAYESFLFFNLPKKGANSMDCVTLREVYHDRSYFSEAEINNAEYDRAFIKLEDYFEDKSDNVGYFKQYISPILGSVLKLFEPNNGEDGKVFSNLENKSDDANCTKRLVHYVGTIFEDISELFKKRCKSHQFIDVMLRTERESVHTWHTDGTSSYRMVIPLSGARTEFCTDKKSGSTTGCTNSNIVEMKSGQGALFHGENTVHSAPYTNEPRAVLIATISCEHKYILENKKETWKRYSI